MMDEQSHIRRHIRIFVNGRQTFDPGLALQPSDEVWFVQALSGG
jgi:molybdopterin synthase sulfur carrier subunit